MCSYSLLCHCNGRNLCLLEPSLELFSPQWKTSSIKLLLFDDSNTFLHTSALFRAFILTLSVKHINDKPDLGAQKVSSKNSRSCTATPISFHAHRPPLSLQFHLPLMNHLSSLWRFTWELKNRLKPHLIGSFVDAQNGHATMDRNDELVERTVNVQSQAPLKKPMTRARKTMSSRLSAPIALRLQRDLMKERPIIWVEFKDLGESRRLLGFRGWHLEKGEKRLPVSS